MIKQNDISEAIQRRLVDSVLPYKIVFEAEDELPERPYIALQVVRLKPVAVMLEEHDGIYPQYMQATVVTETGKFTTEGQKIGDEIAALFPFGTRIEVDAEGHEITINDIPFVESGFRDGFDWRTPVRIDYEVE